MTKRKKEANHERFSFSSSGDIAAGADCGIGWNSSDYRCAILQPAICSKNERENQRRPGCFHLMRDIEDLDVSEIAAMLHVTSNTVKVRLHRAG